MVPTVEFEGVLNPDFVFLALRITAGDPKMVVLFVIMDPEGGFLDAEEEHGRIVELFPSYLNLEGRFGQRSQACRW